MKSATSPSSHWIPSSREPGDWRDSSSGSRSRTTWWPKGVSTGDHGSSKVLYGSDWLPWTTRTRWAPCSVSTTRSQLRANSSTPRRSFSSPTDRPSQASWPSWLPESTTTWWSASAAKWATASVNWGWASRIRPTSGGPASISKPSPAMTKAAGP